MVLKGAGSSDRPRRVDQDLAWWPLAAVIAVGGVICLIAAVGPRAPRSGPLLTLACGVVLVLIAVGLGVFRDVPHARHVALWAGLAATAVMLGQTVTLAGQVLVADGVVLGALYAATCLTGRGLAVYLAAAVAGVTAGMAASSAPFLPIPWVVVVVTVLLTGTVTGRHVHSLRQAASTDDLTGALNRAAFRTAANAALAAAHRHSTALSLALVDLDRFKAVNDTQGHEAGDRLLIAVVGGWRARLRGQDLVARIGGDEFVLVLPDTDTAGAVAIVEELRAHSPARWTAGIATAEPVDTLETMLRRADAELYRRKQRPDGLTETPVPSA